jgi:hypothetical protein
MLRKLNQAIAEATRSEDDRLSAFLDGLDDPIAETIGVPFWDATN